ncbi:HEPN domain-containing protein [Nocardia gipuzkoensis]
MDENDEGQWFLYDHGHLTSLDGLLDGVATAIQALAALATWLRPAVTQVQVSLEPGMGWLEVIGERTRDQFGPFRDSRLVPWKELTLDRLAAWLPMYARLDGLPWGAIEPPEGAVQVQLLTLASLVEGLHRRLVRPQPRRIELSKVAVARVRAAACEAGVKGFRAEGFQNLELAGEILREKLNHLNEITFRQRADDFIDRSNEVLPEILESLPDFPQQLTRARNELAHHLLPKAAEPRDVRLMRWVTISQALPWVLRVVLLREAGLPNDVIRAGFLTSNPFGFHRANMRSLAREARWPISEEPDSADAAEWDATAK